MSFFFGLTVLIALAFAVVPQGDFVEGVALAFLALGAAASLLAIALAARQRLNKHRTSRIPNDERRKPNGEETEQRSHTRTSAGG